MDILDIHPNRTLHFLKARYHTMNTNEKVLVFIHIPKTGGNSINSNIGNERFVTLSHALLRKDLSDEFVPVGLVGTRYQPAKNHFLFSTVRNPFTFFRSYYHHVLGHGEFHNKEHYDYKFAEKGFSYLLEEIMNRDTAWPSRKFLYPQLFNQEGDLVVSWINRNEHLDEDMKMFSELIGFEYQAGERKRAAPVKHLDEYYDQNLKNKVEETYYRELACFNYNDAGNDTVNSLLHDVSENKTRYLFHEDRLFYDEDINPDNK